MDNSFNKHTICFPHITYKSCLASLELNKSVGILDSLSLSCHHFLAKASNCFRRPHFRHFLRSHWLQLCLMLSLCERRFLYVKEYLDFPACFEGSRREEMQNQLVDWPISLPLRKTKHCVFLNPLPYELSVWYAELTTICVYYLGQDQ